MPPPSAPSKPGTAPVIDPTPRPSDVRAYEKMQQGSSTSGSLAALDGFAANIAGMGKAPAVAKNASSGPRYTEPPRTTEEAMSDDIPLVDPHEEPSPSQAEETPAPKSEDSSDDQMGQTSSDILDDLSSLADPKEEKSSEPKEDKVDPEDDASIDKQIEALGPLSKVRVAHKEQLKKNRELQATLDAKTKELTELSEKLKSGTASPELVKELEIAREKVADYEKRLQITDYTKSDEFHQEHVQPLERAISDAFDTVKELSIEIDGERRMATENDFRKILSMDPVNAREAVDEMFGKWGHEVLDHYKTIHKLDRKRNEALSTAETRAVEARQRRQAEAQIEQTRNKELYSNAMKELSTKYADLFGDREGDEEVNTLVSKQRQFVQTLIDNTDMPMEDKIRASAKLHQQAIHYPKVLVDLKRAREELAALKKQMKSYEASEPSEGRRTAPVDLNAEADPFAQLDMIASRKG